MTNENNIILKIVSYNLNGIRAALNKNLLQWIKENNYDIICFQETKAMQEQIDSSIFSQLGYEQYWFSAEKKGYSGVCVLTKKSPNKVVYGCNNKLFDEEGRVIRLDFDEFSIFNIYFPSGTSGELRQEVKYQFLDYIFSFLNDFKKTQSNCIVVGDYNIANTELDIHNAKSNAKTSGFLPEERAWLTKFFNSGWIDSFRYLHKDLQKYSWWSVRTNARDRNIGWRIDYIAISEALKPKLIEAEIDNEAYHSDHCPVFIEIKD